MTDSPDPIPRVTAADPAAGSGDVVAGNVAALARLFPAVLADGKVDFEVLRQLLGNAVEDGQERYGLTWKGKRRARAFALTPSLGTLRPAKEESVAWETTRNLMIEGDNLEVLKLLQKSYAGKVKLIYIDPPYNTGGDFVYPDNYIDSLDNYLLQSGQTDGGVKRTSNPESGGRFHTDWLNMIYPRLIAAHSFLASDGVIAVSIDDNELPRLLEALNEIFGQENSLAVIAVQLNPRGRHLDKFVARTHEYVCLYAKNADSDPTLRIAKDERMASDYNKEDSGGKYRDIELRNRNPAFNSITRPNLYYPIFVDPNASTVSVKSDAKHSIKVLPKNSDGGDSCWTWNSEKLAKDCGVVYGRIVTDGTYRIYRKDYFNDEDGQGATTLPKALWLEKDINNDVGKKRVQQLFGTSVFDFPKSPYLIQRIAEICARPDSLIMDFFAGSGTTGDALLSQNAADNGKRRYILVQLSRLLDPAINAERTAAEYCDEIGKPRTIAELTKERLRRAGASLREEHPNADLDTGFRVYKLATSNLKPWQPDPDNLEASLLDAINNVLPGRTEDDLLVELLLKTGIDLSLPSEVRSIAGANVHALGGGVLMVCLADISEDQAEDLGQGICDWRAELDPPRATTFYFKDAGFQNAATKANLAAIIRQRVDKGVEKLASI